MLNLIWQHDAKRIWNDEVIKQFVYLVSKIDWVIMAALTIPIMFHGVT